MSHCDEERTFYSNVSEEEPTDEQDRNCSEPCDEGPGENQLLHINSESMA